MTTTKNRMANENDLENLTRTCEQVNEMPLRSQAQKIKQLVPELTRLSGLGYSQDALVDAMKKGGINTTVASLRTTIWRFRNQ